MGFVETSAKTGNNVDFAFNKIVEGNKGHYLIAKRNSPAHWEVD